MINDDVFSIRTGSERARIVGPVLQLWTSGFSAKIRNRKGSAGARPLPLQCLSQLFPVEEKIDCLENEFLCVCLRTFHRWGGLIFIMDDHDNFPSWIMIRISLPLGDRFYFLIVNRLIRDN